MAKTYEITAPDGKVYEVTAPDNATQDQVLAYAKQNYQPKTSRVDQIPGILPEAKTKEPGLIDKVMGVPDAALSMATAIPASVAGNVAGVVRGVTNGIGTPEGVRNAQDVAQGVTRALTYSPRTEGGKAVLSDIGEVVDKTKIAGIGPTEAMALANLAGPAAAQARSAVKPVVQAIGDEAGMVKSAVGGAVKSVLPTPRPEVVRLARIAQNLDIPVRPDMLTDNRFARMLGEAFEKIPATGSKSEARQVGFNRALISQIGGDRNATRLTPDVFKAAMDEAGGKIGEIANKTPIAIDQPTAAVLKRVSSEAARYQTRDVGNVVKNYVKEILDKGDTLDGVTFRKINSKIGAQVRGSSNGDLRMALMELQDELHEILSKNIKDKADLAVLQDARQKYAIGSTLTPLVAKSTTGDISPSGLMSAVTSSGTKKGFMARGGGEIGDLARIGQLFMKDPPSSGTTERAAVYGGMLGGGAIVEPTTAAGVFGAANLYNRLGPSVTNKILGADPLRR